MSESVFRIELLGFGSRTTDDAVAGVARVFKISEEKARRLVGRLPSEVKASASKSETKKYVATLVKIGGDVRVIDQRGQSQTYAGRGRRNPPTPNQPRRAPAPASSEPTSEPATNVVSEYDSGLDDYGVAPPSELVWKRSPSKTTSDFARVPSHVVRGFDERPSTGSSLVKPPLRLVGVGGNPFVVSSKDDDRLFLPNGEPFDPRQALHPMEGGGSGLLAIVAVPLAATGVTADHGKGALPHDPEASPKPVREQRGGTMAPESDAIRSDLPASVAIRGPSAGTQEALRGSADVGFWNHIHHGFATSFKNPSWSYLLLFTFLGGLTAWILKFGLLIPGITMIFAVIGLYLLFCCFLSAQFKFFASGFAIGIRGFEGRHQILEVQDWKADLAFPGFLLSFGLLLLSGPMIYEVISIFDGPASVREFDPTRLFLYSLIPYIYWPMAMASIATQGRLTEFFNVIAVFRGMAVGGLEYLFCIVVVVGLQLLVNLIAGLTASLFLTVISFYLILGYLGGVQGYLLGKLLRRRPSMIQGAEAVET